MTPRSLTPQEAAACLVAILERRGAVFTLKPDAYFHCNLDPSDVATRQEPDDLSHCMLAMRDEIRAELIARRVTH